MLERVEETLDEIAFAVEGEIARTRGFSVGFGWDDRGDRSIVEGGDEGVGVEGLVVNPPRDRPMACAPCFFERRRYAGERARWWRQSSCIRCRDRWPRA